MGRWAFGSFVLDLDTRELVRAGTSVPLSPKAFHLLRILIENRPKALSKSDLQDQLWPGSFVVEKNLTNLVSEIREALDDDPAQPRFIRTVHRFGYAFQETPRAESEARTALHNLPMRLTNFVGRDRDIADLSQLVASARLVTLTGTGGCGKTRLALELAATLLAGFPDGVWVVDLAAISNPGFVAQTVASVFDVREGPNRPIQEALLDYVRNRHILLILDNCEHLITACAQLADAMLAIAPRLHILATSRERLGLTGETVWRVSSLSVPEPIHGYSAESLSTYDAVRLFVERAAAVDPAFRLTPANFSLVADVCQRLDGIPLAIELAAARMNVLSIEQIESRLNDRFQLLTGGSRTAPPRHRTLKAAVDWSYDLLSDDERQLLRRLSVFAGGWNMAAAEHVTGGSQREQEAVLEVLSRLIDQSLVIVDSADSEVDEGRRYRFLETVRQYAQERLEPGEVGPLRDRHLACFDELVRRAEPELTRSSQVAWLDRLQREHDNLRLALEWSLAAPERGERGLELATALFNFWMKRGLFREGREYLERALLAAGSAPAVLKAKALMSVGTLTFFQGEFDRARAWLDESAALAQAADDLSVLGFSLGMRAVTALELGNIAEGVRFATEGQAAGRASASPWVQCPSLACLAYLAMHTGDFDTAGRLHEEALELARRQGEKWGVGISLFDLALLRIVQQRHAQARALCAEGIALHEEFRDRRGVAWCLGILSGADAAAGHALRAARLRGAMEGLLESVGAPIQASFNRWIGDRYLDAMKDCLGDATFQAAMDEGRSLSLPRAIELGLESGG